MVENQHKKIKGYRDLSEDEIAAMNLCKGCAEGVEMVCSKIEELVLNVDKRWLAIAKTDLQKGFMALVRSIARPTTF